MFLQAIIVSALLLAPGSPSQEPVAGTLPFLPDEIVSQVSQERDHLGSRGSVLGPWESPGTALLEEFMIDTSITWVGAPDWQWSPAIAFDGTNYLVVWHDDRNGLDYGVYGTRVTQTGAVLDPRGIVISDIERDQSYPSVAFDGVDYLVVWQDYRSGTDYDLYGTRVEPSGNVLDPSGLPVSTKSTRERYPKLAFDGSNHLVVWEEGISKRHSEIYATRVSPFGTVLDPLGITVCDDTLCQRFPSVTFGAGNYLLTWVNGKRENPDIFAARIDTSGSVRDSSGIVVCSTAYVESSPAVGFDGRNFLVVWEHWWGTKEIDILGARVDTSGMVLDSTPALICTLAQSQRHPELAFGDSTYLVVWQHKSRSWPEAYWDDVCGAVVDTAGRVSPWWVDSLVVTDAIGWQRSPAVAFDGTNHFVVWGDNRSTNGDIYGSRVKNWNVLDPEGFCLSGAPDRKWYPSVAFASPNYLVVWQNGGGDGDDIWGGRITQSGSILDPMGILLSDAVKGQSLPRVASDGLDYLVVWEDLRDTVDWGSEASRIYGCRVTRNGDVLDTSGICVSRLQTWQWDMNPSVASNGDDYLVVWEAHTNSWIKGAVVHASGTVDTLLTLISPHNWGRTPSVASDGANWLATWSSLGNINGARVNGEGTVLDPICFSICTTQVPSLSAHHQTAFGGGVYLVVWEDIRSGSEYDIYGARVDTSGILLDTTGIAIAVGPGYQAAPSVVFDGDNFLVVWEDWQTGESNLWGARVDTSGVVLDSGGVELINQSSGRMAPSLAKGADNNLLLVYDGIAGYPYDGYRVFGALYTDVGIQESDPDAVSRWKFRLDQSSPNPFSTSTRVRYTIPAKGHVVLSIYDSSGRLVNQLDSGMTAAGSHTVTWTGRDTSGRELPSGIYFCRLQAGDATATRKMTLLR